MPIRKQGNKYKIENVKGTSNSRADAYKRLRAIKASQSAKKKK